MFCISVMENDFDKCKSIIKTEQMVEIRADLCKFSVAQIEELVSLNPNVLITCRIENSSLNYAKEQICAAIKKGAKYVDIEIETPCDYLEYIKSYARANGCKLIISYHNFSGTQSLQELEQIYDLCRRKGADIAKIVTTANSTEDAIRLMQLYKYHKCDKEITPNNFMEHGEQSGSLSNSYGEQSAQLLAFCMGKAGQFTRELCLHLGAPYTYVAYKQQSATAPGQYTLNEITQLFSNNNFTFICPDKNSTIFKGNNTPQVRIPCSKSVAQRAILAAALAKGESILHNFEPCNDINGAINVVQKLGAEVLIKDNTLHIKGIGPEGLKNISSIEVGESGLLTRLLIPLAAFISSIKDNCQISINGHGSILTRNLSESINALQAAGASCSSNNGYLPFTINKGFDKCNIEFSGKASSQIVSGFLMTLPLVNKDCSLSITNPTSIPYIHLTIRTLKQFGIEIITAYKGNDKIVFKINKGQQYKASEIYLDSDWSSAAYFAVAGALSNGICLLDMPLDSSQADEYVLQLISSYGHRIEKQASGDLYNISIYPAENKDVTVNHNLTNCPDLFPVATTLAGLSNASTSLVGANRLLEKESNRAQTIFSEFSKLGADVNISNNIMYIKGAKENLHSANVFGHNDHRIAMSLIIAKLFINGQVKIDSIKCIDKSFPSFLEKLTKE